MVECQLEDVMSWVRGTVVNIDLSQALYDVALESVRIGNLLRAIAWVLGAKLFLLWLQK